MSTQAEQSKVGKVLSSCAMCPPTDGSFSTKYTWKPASAISSAHCIPAIPPPIISADGVTPTRIGSKDSNKDALATALAISSFAFSVPFSLSEWTQLHCSRIFAISRQYAFKPASSHALLNVTSCMRGEQEATTTRSSFASRMSLFISS